MVERVKVTFVVPLSLGQELKEKVIKDGYGMRGKSRWISEAILNLLDMKNYPELVSLGTELRGLQSTETIVLEKQVKKQMDNAVVDIRKKYPILEGVQSGIVRTAIIQRLLRVQSFPLK